MIAFVTETAPVPFSFLTRSALLFTVVLFSCCILCTRATPFAPLFVRTTKKKRSTLQAVGFFRDGVGVCLGRLLVPARGPPLPDFPRGGVSRVAGVRGR